MKTFSQIAVTIRTGRLILSLCFAALFCPMAYAENAYSNLISLFDDWREFERPPFKNGAPDYTANTFEIRYKGLHTFKTRLNQFDTSNWPIKNKVDWYILLAEMNGFESNHRVLKPWKRDPAFYKSIWSHKSDVPAHEGPTHHAITELWSYQFPLSKAEENRLISELKIIVPLNKQAKKNLTGNARDLWVAGIRDIRHQSAVLSELELSVKDSASPDLLKTIDAAKEATDDLVAWLEKKAKHKTGPSGIGKDNYTWYQQNVHLVPLTWEQEVTILKRELERAWASLKLEEHRNRHLPQLKSAATPEEYDALAVRSAEKFLKFLDEEDIVTVADYFEPALRPHLGSFVPIEKRNFFYITSHFDPTPLYSHFYHWFELARMEYQPHKSPIRKGALLYNIFDSRNEGTATAVEEMFMQAGLYDDNPRVREIVWIMIAQRAARGLGSLYAHANDMTMKEAGGVHMDWTPRGWMKTEPELLIFEQHLYLRQPGYGTSYITGKYLLERTMADYAKMLEEQGKTFQLKTFFDELNAIGSIPISLSRWELTGLDNEIKSLNLK